METKIIMCISTSKPVVKIICFCVKTSFLIFFHHKRKKKKGKRKNNKEKHKRGVYQRLGFTLGVFFIGGILTELCLFMTEKDGKTCFSIKKWFGPANSVQSTRLLVKIYNKYVH